MIPHCFRMLNFLEVARFDPLTMTAMALTAAGSAVSAMGTIAGGKAAQQAGMAAGQSKVFEAKQLEQNAQQERAVSQRQASEQRRQGTLLQSKLVARAAASGGGVSDPTIANLAEDIGERSELSALTEMYKGENRARGMLDQAMGTRMTADALVAEGEEKRRASKVAALSTIIGGAGSMYNVARGGPVGGYARYG